MAAATASATVAIKLSVTGEAAAKQALNRIEGRLQAIDAKSKGLENRFNGIATAVDKYDKSLDSHMDKVDRYEKSYDKLEKRLNSHVQSIDIVKRYYDDLNTKMADNGRVMQAQRRDYADLSSDVRGLGYDLRATNSDFKTFGNSIDDLHKKKLVPLDKELQNKKKDFAALRKEMDSTEKSTDRMSKTVNRLNGDGDGLFKRMFGKGIKFAKLFGIEFLALSAVIGLFRGALWLGEVSMKGFEAALSGVGIAAGAAVAALSAFLAAQRELQVVKLSPFFAQQGKTAVGSSDSYTQVSGIVGARQLQMFDQKTLGGIAAEAAKSGDASRMSFRAMIDTLADFAIVATDPNKALTTLTSTFAKASKEGKISADQFKEISEASPELVKGLEEMYGGADKLKSALSAGKVDVKSFIAAIDSGRLDSLRPFQNALEDVNDTLIGTFKGALAPLKEQLIELGMPLLDSLKAPILRIEREIRILLMRIKPTIQETFGTLFGDMGGPNSGLSRFMTRLAVLINENLPKLIGMGKKIGGWVNSVQGWFRSLGDYLRKMSKSWDILYENILRPVGVEIWRTFNHLIEAFGSNLETSAEFGESFASKIDDIGEGVRKLIDGFMHLKNALAPIIDTFTRFLQIISKVLGALGGVGQFLAAAGLTGMFMGRGGKGGRRGRGGAGGAGGGGGFFGSILAPFLFPFGGGMRDPRPIDPNTPWGKARTQYGLARNPQGSAGSSQQGRLRSFGMAGSVFFKEGSKKFFTGKNMKTMAAAGLPLAANLVGGLISGKSKQTNVGMQTLGGALSGAGTGAMIGGMVGGPVGAAIGAVGGGIIGGVTGFLGAKDAQREEKEATLASMRERAFAGYVVNDIQSLGRLVVQGRNMMDLFGAGGKSAAGYKGALETSLIPGAVGLTEDSVNAFTGDTAIFATRLAQALVAPYTDANGVIDYEKASTPNSRAIADILMVDNYEELYGETPQYGDVRDFAALGVGSFDYAATRLYGDPDEAIKALDELISSGLLDEAATSAATSLKEQTEFIQVVQKSFPEVLTMDPQEVFTKYNEIVTEQEQMYSRMNDNISALSDVMGMSTEEAQNLASSLDIDLAESFISLGDIIRGLGYSSDEMANRATAAGRMLEAALKPIEERRAQRDFDQRYDAAGKAFTDVVYGSVEEAMPYAEDYVGAVFERELDRYTKGELTYEQLQRSLSLSFSGQREGLVAQYGEDMPNIAAFDQIVAETMAIFNDELSTRMQFDPMFALGFKQFAQGEISDVAGGKPLTDDVWNANKDVLTTRMMDYLSGKGITADKGTVETLLRGEFIDSAESLTGSIDELIAAMTDTLGDLTVTANGQIQIYLKEGEESSVSGSVPVTTQRVGPPDTATPRAGLIGDTVSSRLGRTLAKHSMFNSMVSGSRFVTSSYRTDNLGSINSDHVTGNAYDLTGDNLGQYAANINDAGGFAEFHGSAGSRHLHVVPPQGDTTNPAQTSTAGGQVVINAPITVTATDGQSAKEIANYVIAEIERLKRTAMERR